MASFSASPIFSLFFTLHILSISAIPNLHKTKNLITSQELILSKHPLNDTKPTKYFEVTKPIKVPKTKPCTHLILQHDFGYTYGKPPVLANYSPPSQCSSHRKFSKIVLEWKATCKGRQFDRIFGVWLSGVEILRSCTAEPRPNGIVWTVKKDITRYYSLLMKNQTLSVYLGNLIDDTYTGVYHVNVSVYFYPVERHLDGYESKMGTLNSWGGYIADLIIPISRNLPLNDGQWFEVRNSSDVQLKEFSIPRNVYRAVLEVCVSFHENDEFWYSNLPNEYIKANNLSGVPGNGPFREVVVSLDDVVVGAVWPFTVIYTGGVNPLLWRPISGIGSFNLPSYDLEITPFLGNVLDGKSHKFGFGVTNALNVWFVNGNLHLWLDAKSTRTEGKLSHKDSHSGSYSVSNFKGLNGKFVTSESRNISSIGWVKSSRGKITTVSVQKFNYSNTMLIEKDGNLQVVDQVIDFNGSVHAKTLSSHGFMIKSYKRFPLYMYSEDLDQGNDTSVSIANVTLGFNEKRLTDVGFGSTSSSLINLQNGQGRIIVKDNLVLSGLGSTQQVYEYDSSNFCYYRNISSSNYTILFDEVKTTCAFHLGFGNKELQSIPTEEVSLASDLHDSREGYLTSTSR